MIRVVLSNSNNVVYFNDLYDTLNEVYVNDASVQVWFYDVYGNEVDDQAWPLNLEYNPGSNGDYHGVLDDDIDLQVGQFYRAKVVIDDGPGRHLEEMHDLEIVDRQP